MMERMSSIVSYESKSLQTNITRMDPLDILNPTNASLLVPLTIGPSQCNGHSHNNPPEPPEELQLRDIEDQSEDDQEPEVPSDVEVIQPARPPADGLYRFGMGGINLLAAKKKKYRTNSMAPPKKRKPKTVLFGFGDEGGGRRVRGDGGEGVSEEGESSMERGNQDEGVRRTVVERFVGINQGRESPMKRSRRIAGVNRKSTVIGPFLPGGQVEVELHEKKTKIEVSTSLFFLEHEAGKAIKVHGIFNENVAL